MLRPPACQENRTLREQNFELQSKSRADQNALKRIQAEFADKDKQLRIVVDQHAELLRCVASCSETGSFGGTAAASEPAFLP